MPSLDAVLTNVLPAKVVDTFCFYLYSIDATDKKDDLIDSRSRRLELFGLGFWDGHLSGMMSAAEKKELRRMVFFAGSFFYSARAIPGLEPNRLPVMLCNGSTTNGDTMECVDARRFTTPLSLLPPTVAAISLAAGEVAVDGFRCRNCTRTFANENDMLQHCRMTGHGPIYLGTTNDGLDEGMISRPATNEVFISYVSLALERAMGERLTRWGREFVDRDAPIAATDRQGRDLGVSIFEAISLSLGLLKIGNQPPSLTLTCDLKAKVIRNISVLDCIYESRGSQPFTPQEKTRLRQQWIGTVVIYKNDHKCKYFCTPRL